MAIRYLLVGNPTAQTGRAKQRIDAALGLFRRRGLQVAFVSTEPDGRTIEVVRRTLDTQPFDVVIYLGGDGTFAEVAKGILRAKRIRPMGMLPSGTANDQGRSFGIRADASAIDENIDVVVGGHVIALDVGRVECLGPADEVMATDLFFDSAGWGLQPDILAVRNRDRERIEKIPLLREIYRDAAVYVGATLERYLASWVEPTKFDAEIIADGRTHQYAGLTDIIINATPVYGGFWVLDRHSEPDDGRFELIPMQGRRDWFSKALRDLESVPLWQDHLDALKLTHSEGVSASSFELRLFRPERASISSQIDGETWHASDAFRVTVLPRRLPLIVRPDFAPPWRPAS